MVARWNNVERNGVGGAHKPLFQQTARTLPRGSLSIGLIAPLAPTPCPLPRAPATRRSPPAETIKRGNPVRLLPKNATVPPSRPGKEPNGAFAANRRREKRLMRCRMRGVNNRVEGCLPSFSCLFSSGNSRYHLGFGLFLASRAVAGARDRLVACPCDNVPASNGPFNINGALDEIALSPPGPPDDEKQNDES